MRPNPSGWLAHPAAVGEASGTVHGPVKFASASHRKNPKSMMIGEGGISRHTCYKVHNANLNKSLVETKISCYPSAQLPRNIERKVVYILNCNVFLSNDEMSIIYSDIFFWSY